MCGKLDLDGLCISRGVSVLLLGDVRGFSFRGVQWKGRSKMDQNEASKLDTVQLKLVEDMAQDRHLCFRRGRTRVVDLR